MKKYKMIYMFSVVIMAALIAVPVFAQDAEAPAEQEEEAVSNEISVYGEVQEVNADSNSMKVQYYDYDNDQEKLVEVVASQDTRMENIGAVGEIKQGDWVDVTYAVSEGKNIAKFIMVEREEPSVEEAMEETPE